MGNAVKFLSDPSVRNSPAEKQLGFLRGKGLNDEEIEESYRKAGLNSPTSASASQSTYNPYPSTSYQTGGNFNTYSPYSGSTPYQYDVQQQQQDHIFQLARNSTTARWLLLLAIVASTMTFLARNIPNSLYKRFFNWIQKIFNPSSEKSEDEPSNKLIELAKRVEQIKSLIEGLSRRQNDLELRLTSFQYLQPRFGRNEYNDCIEEIEADIE